MILLSLIATWLKDITRARYRVVLMPEDGLYCGQVWRPWWPFWTYIYGTASGKPDESRSQLITRIQNLQVIYTVEPGDR